MSPIEQTGFIHMSGHNPSPSQGVSVMKCRIMVEHNFKKNPKLFELYVQSRIPITSNGRGLMFTEGKGGRGGQLKARGRQKMSGGECRHLSPFTDTY